MNSQQAQLLISYINKAIPCVPVTGQEWEMLKPVFGIIDQIANGKIVMRQESTATDEPLTGEAQRPPKPHAVT